MLILIFKQQQKDFEPLCLRGKLSQNVINSRKISKNGCQFHFWTCQFHFYPCQRSF